jgi:hypothetical protein
MSVARFFALCVLVFAPIPSQAAIIGELAADWSDSSNPNGAWSYNNSNGAITTHQSDWPSAASEWDGQDAWAVTAIGQGHIVSWLKTDRTLAAPYDFQSGDVLTHSWDSANGATGTTNVSSVTWTAASPGIYDFSGNLWLARNIGRAVNATVIVDSGTVASVSLFDGDSYSRAAPFQFASSGVSLSAGDKIELRFVTTSTNGEFVGVNLTVSSIAATPVPEPISALLFAPGLLGLFIFNRRRLRKGGGPRGQASRL